MTPRSEPIYIAVIARLISPATALCSLVSASNSEAPENPQGLDGPDNKVHIAVPYRPPVLSVNLAQQRGFVARGGAGFALGHGISSQDDWAMRAI